MTGTTRTSADISPRRKRILFRAWHRGIREMDLVFGQFADDNIAELSEETLDELEVIMAESDRDLMQWITGEKPVPENFQTPLFEKIMSYRPDFDPVTEETVRKDT